MLSEIKDRIPFLSEWSSQSGPITVKTKKEIVLGQVPYRVTVDKEKVAQLIQKSCSFPEIIVRKGVLCIDSECPRDEMGYKMGQLDTPSLESSILQIRLFAGSSYIKYLELARVKGEKEAREEIEKQMALTVVHEGFHYVCRYCNNLYVTLNFLANPGLAELAAEARQKGYNFDDEEIVCEAKSATAVEKFGWQGCFKFEVSNPL
jgi:hypothetical protein